MSTQPMRVAHIIHSLGAGGAEAVLVELARLADRAGIELVVVGLSDAEDNRAAERLRAEGVTVHELHAGRYSVRTVARVHRLLRRERIEIVHTHLKHADVIGGLAARRLGIPAVSTLHLIEDQPPTMAARTKVAVAALIRRLLFTRVITLSRAQRDWYAGLAGGVPIDVIPNGVAAPRAGLTRAAVRAELGAGHDTIVALTVSLMRPEKGHGVLLDAAERLAQERPDLEVVWVLAGDGPLLDQVRTSVAANAALRRRVRVLGFRADVDDLLAAADVVVHPSFADALPTALISALAAARPIVATDVGGIPDIVSPVCGTLVPPHDPSALAGGVAALADDPVCRDAMGWAASARYRREFSAEVWVARLANVYRAALGLSPSLDHAAHSVHATGRGSSIEPVRTAVVLSTVTPYPTDNGKSVVIAGFLRHLVDRLGVENVTYLHVGDPIEDVSGFGGVTVREMGRPTRTDLVRGLILDAGLRRRSLQEALTASPGVARRIRSALDELGPDLELIDTIRMTQHVRASQPGRRRVVYLDDLFSVRYRRMIAILQAGYADFDPIGQFAQFVPRWAQFLTRLPATRMLLLRMEANRVERSERQTARQSHLSLLLNDVEAQALRLATGGHVAVVPPSVHPLSTSPASAWQGEADFAFVGLLSIPHNHDGILWFLHAIMPRVLRSRPDARLHIIGRQPGDSLLRAAAAFGDRVVIHGFVEDLSEVLTGMAALVNPLRFGSGVKIKVLDGLSCGVPVVATTIGAEGIALDGRCGIIVVDEADKMADALVGLTDPQRRAQEAAAASAYYARSFSTAAVESRYDTVFGTLPTAGQASGLHTRVSRRKPTDRQATAAL